MHTENAELLSNLTVVIASDANFLVTVHSICVLSNDFPKDRVTIF